MPTSLGNSGLPTSRVLESLKAGKRQAEAPFINLKIAAKGQQSVYNLFKTPNTPGSAATG
jgi:hypothetical protein